jgi:hypothetical protein
MDRDFLDSNIRGLLASFRDVKDTGRKSQPGALPMLHLVLRKLRGSSNHSVGANVCFLDELMQTT